jgi:antitoxin component of MazEF toxin-antitoxin module
MAMIKRLTAIGNSLGLIIDRPILELLEIDKETPLEVRTDGEMLIIRPQRRNRSARLKAAAERMMNAHDETMRKLAK